MIVKIKCAELSIGPDLEEKKRRGSLEYAKFQ